MKSLFLKFIFSLFISFSMFSQNLDSLKIKSIEKKYDIKSYPEGLYYDMVDFDKKTPNQIIKLERRTVNMNKKVHKDSILDQCNFVSIDKKKGKIMNVFAISFENNIYFGEQYLKKFSKEGSKFQDSGSNSFFRVIRDGNFFYLESFDYSGSGMSTTIAAGGGLIGGVIGAIVNENTTHIYGLIFRDKKFEKFKNCEKFNQFLTERKVSENLNCENSDYNMINFRKIILKIIQ